MLKAEWEKIIGHSIRNDTYILLERMSNNENYNDIIEDIEKDRSKYDIKDSYILTKEKTIKEYLSLTKLSQQKEEQQIIKREVPRKYKVIKKKIPGQVEESSVKKRRQIKDPLYYQHGIYGIYIDNILIYIGKTNKNFGTRFGQHKQFMNSRNFEDKTELYKILQSAKESNRTIMLKPLIIVENLKTDFNITVRDLEAMELALITLYKPQCNIEGLKKEYVFRNDYKKNKE